jgi:hypothetical protein
LEKFVHDVRRSGWWGKEREAISYFAFGFLVSRLRWAPISRCRSDWDRSTCAASARPERQARPARQERDYQGPGHLGSAWGHMLGGGGAPSLPSVPLAVMQWKVNRGCVSPDDVAWLVALPHPNRIAAVMLCASTSNRRFECDARGSTEGRSNRIGWRSGSADAEELWLQEAERRLGEIKSGKVAVIPRREGNPEGSLHGSVRRTVSSFRSPRTSSFRHLTSTRNKRKGSRPRARLHHNGSVQLRTPARVSGLWPPFGRRLRRLPVPTRPSRRGSTYGSAGRDAPARKR